MEFQKNKKILFIYYKLFKPGGVSRVLCSLVNELVNKGCDVTILVLINNKKSFYELDKRVKILTIDTFSHWGFTKINVNLNKYFPKLPYKNNIKNYVYDFGQWEMLNNWMNDNHHNYNVIVSCWYKLSSQLALNKGISKKTIAWEHANFEVGGILWNNILRKKYRNLKAVICLNNASHNYYKAINSNALKIINLIGDPFESYDITENTNKKNTLIYVGRLDEDKNVNELINIVEEINLKDFKFKIIGEGSVLHQLKNYVENSAHIQDKVEFLGKKDLSQIYNELSRSKIFLFTSKTECLPTVLIEANFTANALISYDCKYGPSDIINDNNGFLIPMHDKKMFQEKLQFLIDNPDVLNNLCKVSHNESKNWKKDKIIHQWIEVINH